MSFWIYKCNAKEHPPHVYFGNWDQVFEKDRAREWGTTEFITAFSKLSPGDLVISYQTDRNEIVGLVEVLKLRPRNGFHDLIVRPIEKLGVQVRPLKKLDKRIAALSCFGQANIATIYEISTTDAWHLLKVVKAQLALQIAIKGC